MLRINIPEKESNDPLLTWLYKFKDKEQGIEEIKKFLSKEYGIDFYYIDPENPISEESINEIKNIIDTLSKKSRNVINKNFLITNKIVPYKIVNNMVYFLTQDILLPNVKQEISMNLPMTPIFQITFVSVIDKILKNVVSEADLKIVKEEVKTIPETEIRKIINDIIESALVKKATDIHIFPTPYGYQIKFRINGILIPIENFTFDDVKGIAIINKLETDAGLPPTERKHPLSGSLNYTKFPNIDFRLETVGTVIYSQNKDYYGRTKKLAVLRILEKQKKISEIDNLGFAPEQLDYLKRTKLLSQGMIIIVGPTGSGKTTTLYSLLYYINDNRRHIITIENPVEYEFAFASQLEVDEFMTPPLTFGKLLRSSLRLDPDIILVGEIRDEETASTAIAAAHTGHLVLTTLHANEISLIPQRINTLGVNVNLFCDSAKLLLSQRLVPTPCPKCSVSIYLSDEQISLLKTKLANIPNLPLDKLELEAFKTINPEGCHFCSAGTVGLQPVSELLWINDDIRDIIKKYWNEVGKLREELTRYQNETNKKFYFSMFEDSFYKLIDKKVDPLKLISILRSIE